MQQQCAHREVCAVNAATKVQERCQIGDLTYQGRNQTKKNYTQCRPKAGKVGARWMNRE